MKRQKRLQRKAPLRGKGGLKRTKGPNPDSVGRFAQHYGSKEYVEYLHGMACSVCGVSGWTQAAHTRAGGIGTKAGPETLVPLCGTRYGTEGCHQIFDEHPWDLPEGTVARLQRLAPRLWAAWQKRSDDG